jgi:hypothetical protein
MKAYSEDLRRKIVEAGRLEKPGAFRGTSVVSSAALPGPVKISTTIVVSRSKAYSYPSLLMKKPFDP